LKPDNLPAATAGKVPKSGQVRTCEIRSFDPSSPWKGIWVFGGRPPPRRSHRCRPRPSNRTRHTAAAPASGRPPHRPSHIAGVAFVAPAGRPEEIGPSFVCTACFGRSRWYRLRRSPACGDPRGWSRRSTGSGGYLELAPRRRGPGREDSRWASTALVDAGRLAAGPRDREVHLKTTPATPRSASRTGVVAVAVARRGFGVPASNTIACAPQSGTSPECERRGRPPRRTRLRGLRLRPADLEAGKIDHASVRATVVVSTGSNDDISGSVRDRRRGRAGRFVNVNLRRSTLGQHDVLRFV
jgi:hypothetical protein